jgi:DNA-binding MarR family transcriptional regulator
VRLGRRLQESDQFADGVVAVLWVAERELAVDLVVVATSDVGLGQVAGLLELVDDLPGRSFGDADGGAMSRRRALGSAAINRCLADRLGAAVATAGGGGMRPSFGFVLRAVATERPTVSRLAELLGIGKQGASRLADDMVSLGYLERTDDPADRRRTHLRLSATGERGRTRALAESHAIEDELRGRFGDTQLRHLRALLIDFIERHGGADELAAQRSRAPDEPSCREVSELGVAAPAHSPKVTPTARDITWRRRPPASLGGLAPDFTAQTADGEIRFHEWRGSSWGILFSRPAAFGKAGASSCVVVEAWRPGFTASPVA